MTTTWLNSTFYSLVRLQRNYRLLHPFKAHSFLWPVFKQVFPLMKDLINIKNRLKLLLFIWVLYYWWSNIDQIGFLFSILIVEPISMNIHSNR